MKIGSIKRHLRPYIIAKARASTMTNAFAAAIADHDSYDERAIREAIQSLGQDPDGDLLCVYCGQPATTWDHLFPLVRNRMYSGYGHQIGNLVPCCHPCNSNKGGKNWQTWLATKPFADSDRKIATIRRYHERFLRPAAHLDPVTSEYAEILDEILRLMERADQLAEKIRNRVPARAARSQHQSQ